MIYNLFNKQKLSAQIRGLQSLIRLLRVSHRVIKILFFFNMVKLINLLLFLKITEIIERNLFR